MTNEIKRNTTRDILRMKGKNRIAVLTAYDTMTAMCLDEAGIDALLIGDSLGNVVYGMETTLAVSMDMILEHSAAVHRGSEKAFLIADLPFMSYQSSIAEAMKNASLCLSKGNVQAVKLEGASLYIQELCSRLTESGIPVMGHIGLTPQSIHQMGGFYTHGKDEKSAAQLLQSAKALEESGCFSIVLECVEEGLAKKITDSISIPTIGIGSGAVCDGEVLVVNDVLGYSRKAPKFATNYMNLRELVTVAAKKYVEGVKGNEK